MKQSTLMWFHKYDELASELHLFYEKSVSNSNSAGHQLYNLLINDSRFLSENKWFEKFYGSNLIQSVDPMHVFASISPNNLSDDKRKYRIELLLDILRGKLDSSRKEEKDYLLDFDGCPAPPQIHSLAIRNEDHQEEIWSSFVDIFLKGQNCDLNAIFLKSKKWYGFSIRLLTIYLFWIRPDCFLPLDRNTVALLKENKVLKRDPRNADEYKKLLSRQQGVDFYKNLALISYDADFYARLNDFEKKEIDLFLNRNSNEDFGGIKHQLRLLAIKPLDGCKSDLIKTLKKGEVYKLTSDFELKENGILKKSKYGLYDIDKIKVNVCAVVGKNGTGKSALVELFMVATNNFYYKSNADNKNKLCWVDGLHVELYFETDSLYKLTLQGDEVTIIKYTESEDSIFKEQEEINLTDFNFNSYFYSILVNYSLHGLNSSLGNKWLEPLFHKNDGYQTPIVIEPFRNKGNIDINLQDDLVKQRLLYNLLIPEDKENNSQSHRVLKRGKNYEFKAEYFSLDLDENKYKKGEEEKSEGFEKSFIELLAILLDKFQCPIIDVFFKETTFKNDLSFVYSYLKVKLVSITKKYHQYEKYFDDDKNTFVNIPEYVANLRSDTSHRVVKLRRAINYLKFDLYRNFSDEVFSIDKVSTEIEAILSRTKKDGVILDEERLEFLLPPSFFSFSIFLEHGIEFSKFSSGEKQIIFSIHSLLYHLRNVDTTQVEDGSYKYDSFNIFLDEIELCFHPELQRTYFSDLRYALTYFSKEASYIRNINICFITHSPFILSDITSDNVLFLDHDDGNELLAIPYGKEIKTFSANIHDLLNNGFFVDGTIGRFAESCIKEIVVFSGKVRVNVNSNREDLKIISEEYESLKPRFYYILSSVADEYIRKILTNHLSEIEELLNISTNNTGDDERRILELEYELEMLKSRSRDE